DVTRPPLTGTWDVVTNTPVDDAALALAQTVSPAAATAASTDNSASTDSPTPAASPVSAAAAADPRSLTWFVRFTPQNLIQGETTAPLDGSTLYALDSFSFDVKNPVTIGSATSGAGAGKATFDPLNLEFSDSSLTPSLFRMVASGERFSKVDVLGYRQD